LMPAVALAVKITSHSPWIEALKCSKTFCLAESTRVDVACEEGDLE
jgi:hypothetical protein